MNTKLKKDETEAARDSYGPAMEACRDDEQRFVELVVHEQKSFSEAAKLAGWGTPESNSNTYARIGFRLSHRPRIQDAIAEEIKKLTRSKTVLKAAQAVDEILDHSYHKDRARVALAVLEKIDPTVQKSEVAVNVKIDHEAEALNQLRSLLALGVAREKLIDLYGAFGLERLEEKIAIEDKSNVVDAEYAEVATDPDADLLGC